MTKLDLLLRNTSELQWPEPSGTDARVHLHVPGLSRIAAYTKAQSLKTKVHYIEVLTPLSV